MSGHSKWESIKRAKGANDAARAKEFTKVARMIVVAAQSGGGDPELNPSLALAIDKAREINMPKDNIERAIKKATGTATGDAGKLEEIVYEGYGPENVAVLVDCTTDNRNRTFGEVRSTIEKIGGRIAETGAVSWQFSTYGQILISFETEDERKHKENAKWNEKLEFSGLPKEQKDEFTLEILDQKGIVDVIEDKNGLEIRTEFAELNNIRKIILSKGIKVLEAGILKASNNPVQISDEQRVRVDEFVRKIEEMDDVQKVWTSLA